MLKMGIIFIGIVTPLQLFIGHEHGINVHEHQPIKLAAMEGHWETHAGAPLILFALPDSKKESNDFEIGIPKLGSLIVTHDMNAEIKGLKEWPVAERPPVAVVFWSFRIMVGIGVLMLCMAFLGNWLLIKGKLEFKKSFLRLCVLMGPAGFIAVLAGWFTTEVGRQPYTVYGLLRTVDSVSPITANSVGMSLIVFVFTYSVIFCAGIFYTGKLIVKGPASIKPSLDDLESRPVLSDRIEIGDHEHLLTQTSQVPEKS